uniref:Extended FMRFamide-10 n=1 Tax=Austrophasma gansbaaiense TaxID=253136 RepID=FAR10_AUSGA|nr:RecName: Full=Extended FMRFamide-10; Short=FMRFa-10 [Austrophasma gansbaaiense]
PAPETNYLRDP